MQNNVIPFTPDLNNEQFLDLAELDLEKAFVYYVGKEEFEEINGTTLGQLRRAEMLGLIRFLMSKEPKPKHRPALEQLFLLLDEER